MRRVTASLHFSSWAKSPHLAAIFSRDLLLSLCSCAVDVSLFVVGVAMGVDIVPATFIARGSSAVFNFLGCRHLVFRTGGRGRLFREGVAYFLLALAIASVSAYLVKYLDERTGLGPTVCKLMVDGFLFGVAFVVKRFSVFSVSADPSEAKRAVARRRSDLADSSG